MHLNTNISTTHSLKNPERCRAKTTYTPGYTNELQPLWPTKRQNQSSEIAVDRVAAAKLVSMSNISSPVPSSLEAAGIRQSLVSVPLERVAGAETMSGILRDV
jgi:hypothetical protein